MDLLSQLCYFGLKTQTKMNRNKKTSRKKPAIDQQAERKERRKKIFRCFTKLAVGLVKIWITNKALKPTAYIVAVDQAEEIALAFLADPETQLQYEQND